MAPDNKTIQSIKNSLPGHSLAIDRVFAESGSFRSVCEDFHVCREALSHWKNVTSDEAAVRRAEYTELLGQLKREILCWLDVPESPSESGSDRINDAERD